MVSDPPQHQNGYSRPTALGIFRSDELLGPGKYRLSLNPSQDYQKAAVEYPYGAATGYGPLVPANAAYFLSIIDVKLFTAYAKMKWPRELMIQYITTNEFQVQSAVMTRPDQS